MLTLGTEPTLAGWLPANMIGGAGVACTMPVLAAGAASRLPVDKLAVGGAVNQTGRQSGGAIGVALLVPLLGTASGAAGALAGFHRMWLFAAACSLLAGLTAVLLGRRQAEPETVRVPATATVTPD
ncbi:MAG: hypothetical protein GEV11_27565 [Streptosporangiales bacterium]|nr:hypothetical protein [Streptosporangiales bacterium]